jgi:hypothetical protein
MCDVHRRRIPEALREPQACVPALSDATVEIFTSEHATGSRMIRSPPMQ